MKSPSEFKQKSTKVYIHTRNESKISVSVAGTGIECPSYFMLIVFISFSMALRKLK